MVEAVLEYVFHYEAVALRRGQKRHHGLLKVCGEAGIGQRLYVDGPGPLVCGYADEEVPPVVPLRDGHAALHELGGYGLKVGGDDVVDYHIAPGGGGGYHKCTRLYLVGYYGVGAAMEPAPALYADNVGARALYVRPHHVEEVGHVHHMGLLCGVGDYGLPLGGHRRQHYVYGGAHAHHVQIYLRAPEPIRPCLYGAALYHYIRAQRPHALYMLVYGPLAYGAAAGKGYLRLLIPAQQRP